MLSISSPAKGAKRINYYVNSVFAEYYVGRGGIAAHWAGNGAELLGLYGAVRTKTLNQLARGYSPDGSIKLVQNAGHPDRQCFWDLTFSAPKSVSVMWALAPEPAQKVIEQCHNRAVEHALRFAEESAGLTRRGKKGVQLERASLVFSIFQHFTSRTLDPQLHSHALLMNVGVRTDGTTGSLWTVELFAQKMAIGAQYQQMLRTQLWEHLNVQTLDEKVAFSVNGVPKALCEELSKRGKQIREQLNALGLNGAVAAKIAALDTRPNKEDVPLSELFTVWRTVAQSHGWSAEQVRELFKPKAGNSQLQVSLAVDPSESAQVRASRAANSIANPSLQGQGAKVREAPARKPAKGTATTLIAKHGGSLITVEWLRPFTRSPFWSPARLVSVPKLSVRLPNRQAAWGEILSQKNYVLFSVKRQAYHPFAQSPFRKLREYSITVPMINPEQPHRLVFRETVRFQKSAHGASTVSKSRDTTTRRSRNGQRTKLVAKKHGIGHKAARPVWSNVRWEWSGKAGGVRLQDRAIFPHVPSWNPVGKLAVPVPRFVLPKEAEKEKRSKIQSQSQSR